MNKALIAVVGPTAIGKTSRAIELAKHFKTEIISADSRQFYKEMSIGTAVPSRIELKQVKHHFIQHRTIHQAWSVGDFERAAIELLEDLFNSRDFVVLVGGSGLYIQAVVEGLDSFPEVGQSVREALNEKYKSEGITYLQNRLKEVDPEYFGLVDIQNPHRLIRALEIFDSSGKPYSSYLTKSRPNRAFQTIFIGLEAERNVIYRRIENRVDKMMEDGLLREAEQLYEHRELGPLQTVGYRELFQYLDGLRSLEEAVAEIKKNTRRFAKRQLTWFRRNKNIHWINYQEPLHSILPIIETQLTIDPNA